MATVKMGVDRLSAPELVAKAQGIHDKVAAHAAFPAPVPSAVDLQKNIDDLAAANAAVNANGGKADYLFRRASYTAVRAALKSWGGYVQMASGGVEDVILGSGFGVVQRGGPIGELSPPKNLGTRVTTMEGRASFVWERDGGADMYHVFMSATNAPFNWELIGATTKSRFNADTLQPGTIYWFAVSAIGAAGETSKSEPLMARAA